MSYGKHIKTEHDGPKNRGRKSGFWGYRADAKRVTKKLRRRRGKQEERGKE